MFTAQRTTGISWTNHTWNPVTGCTSASAGCDHCYARELLNKWFRENVKAAIAAGFTRTDADGRNVVEQARAAGVKLPYSAAQAAQPFSVVQTWPQRLREPYKVKEPARFFVNSLSDVFHPDVPFEFVDQMYDVMEDLGARGHVFQLLTKRPDRMAEYVTRRYAQRGGSSLFDEPGHAPAHIWHGTSIEDGRVLDRLAHLANVPSPQRFVSAEPLIGPWSEYFEDPHKMRPPTIAGLLGDYLRDCGVTWVIVGGESEPGGHFRPLDHAWAREIRDACVRAGVAFFFKQDSGRRTELRPYLVEADGTHWRWHQYPDDLAVPVQVR